MEVECRINNEIFNVLGGHHASLDSDQVIKDGVFDAICVGEGESAIIDLAENIANISTDNHINRIDNLWYFDRENNNVIKSKSASFRQDLDELPYINRNIWDKWIDNPSDYPAILLGRGCPFKCTYCANHAMAKIADGKYTRFRSPENIVGEIENILENAIINDNEKFFLARMLYPHIDAADFVELVKTTKGETKNLDLVFKTEDVNGKIYSIRPPFHPKEIARFQTIISKQNLICKECVKKKL